MGFPAFPDIVTINGLGPDQMTLAIQARRLVRQREGHCLFAGGGVDEDEHAPPNDHPGRRCD
eukprot:451784-Lingulodinium_polyedra.AAC.1